MRTEPFHSTLSFTEVYHNNDQCTEGNNIEIRNLQKGTGNKRLCSRCAELNNEMNWKMLGLASGLLGHGGTKL